MSTSSFVATTLINPVSIDVEDPLNSMETPSWYQKQSLGLPTNLSPNVFNVEGPPNST